MRNRLHTAWNFLRRLTGDDAYERYLRHHAQAHAGQPVLDRKTFAREEIERRWNGVRRCC